MAANTSYSTEPATRGKVVLHTTLGPLDVELWPKEAPKACRNFVQLCLERFFDGLPFHRVIKDFMAQTGDPTGTGAGGESIYGAPFEDEFHGRLRFTHRGLVAMANSAPHSNGSQFFVTLDRCDWLDKRHTIFGKVTGTSVYNLNRFNELELQAGAPGPQDVAGGGGGADRPLHPPLITSTEVLFDPFDDIVPRQIAHTNPAQAAVEEAARTEAARKEARRPKRARNTKLLSFGEEEEEADAARAGAGAGAGPAAGGEGAARARPKSKSVHDLLSDDPRLSRSLAVEVEPAAQALPAGAAAREGAGGAEAEVGGGDGRAASGFAARMRQQQLQRRDQLAARGDGADGSGGAPGGGAGAGEGEGGEGGPQPSRVRAPPPPPPPPTAPALTAPPPPPAPSEYERLKRELVASAAAAQSSGWRWRGRGNAPDSDDEDEADGAGGAGGAAASAASELEARRARLLSKSRHLKALGKKDRAKETALKLQMFAQSSRRAELLGHALQPAPKPMAEGTDDMYEMTDPLAEAGEGAAQSRAMRKIAERKAHQQLSMRGEDGDPEWRAAGPPPGRRAAAADGGPHRADGDQEDAVDYE